MLCVKYFILLERRYIQISKFIIFYLRYPSSSQYSDMAKALVHRWPQLCEQLSIIDAESLWKHRIRMAFKNLRRRSEIKNDPTVQMMKSRYGKKAEKDSPKQINIWGVPNFLPPQPEGEDDGTKAKHIKTLHAQKKLTEGKRKYETINFCMDITFASRREEILNFEKIENVLETYPFLTEGEEVCIFYIG